MVHHILEKILKTCKMLWYFSHKKHLFRRIQCMPCNQILYVFITIIFEFVRVHRMLEKSKSKVKIQTFDRRSFYCNFIGNNCYCCIIFLFLHQLVSSNHLLIWYLKGASLRTFYCSIRDPCKYHRYTSCWLYQYSLVPTLLAALFFDYCQY